MNNNILYKVHHSVSEHRTHGRTKLKLGYNKLFNNYTNDLVCEGDEVTQMQSCQNNDQNLT